jgi:hypothetical protein
VRVFRIASLTRALAPAAITCVIAFVIVAATMGGEEHAGTILLILGAVLLFALGLAAWLLTRTRLEVSSDGIIYHAIGYRVRSTWPNLIGYGKRAQGTLSYESLILREPGIEVSRWLRWSYALMPLAAVASAAQGEIFIPERLSRLADNIPVALFSKDWQADELGTLIHRYAPHVFEHPAM